MVIFQNRLKSEIWGEIWVAHVLKATEGMEVLGESKGFFSACLKIAQLFTSYLADKFLPSFRGVQAGEDQSFPVCGRYKYHLPAPRAQKQAPLCQ